MSRKSNKFVEEPESHERWIVSYADFITLLFAFFVVMYATSESNYEKQKKFQESIKYHLKLIGGFLPTGGTQEKSENLKGFNQERAIQPPKLPLPHIDHYRDILDIIEVELQRIAQKKPEFARMTRLEVNPSVISLTQRIDEPLESESAQERLILLALIAKKTQAPIELYLQTQNSMEEGFKELITIRKVFLDMGISESLLTLKYQSTKSAHPRLLKVEFPTDQ